MGQKGIRYLLTQPGKDRDLIRHHLQSKPRILFGVIHMRDLQPPVLIMLDQMVIGIARKRQGIQPESIDRRCAQFP